MTQETISNLIYLYFIFSSIALMRWGFDILDTIQKYYKDAKTKRQK